MPNTIDEVQDQPALIDSRCLTGDETIALPHTRHSVEVADIRRQ